MELDDRALPLTRGQVDVAGGACALPHQLTEPSAVSWYTVFTFRR